MTKEIADDKSKSDIEDEKTGEKEPTTGTKAERVATENDDGAENLSRIATADYPRGLKLAFIVVARHTDAQVSLVHFSEESSRPMPHGGGGKSPSPRL